MPDQGSTGKRPPPTASTDAFKAASDQAHIDLAVRYSGDSDIDFARLMEAHHRGAIAIARIELEHGKNPEMRELAVRLIASHEKEISQLQQWLASHR
jgi:uncharacterized protein (DUF305 family)